MAYQFQEYPKWIAVDGGGDPSHPGYVLVESADEEAKFAADDEAAIDAPEKPRRGRPPKVSDE